LKQEIPKESNLISLAWSGLDDIWTFGLNEGLFWRGEKEGKADFSFMQAISRISKTSKKRRNFKGYNQFLQLMFCLIFPKQHITSCTRVTKFKP